MFRNRALSIQLVKTPSDTTVDSPKAAHLEPDEIVTIFMYHAEYAVKGLAVLYVGKVVLDAGRDIALMYAESKFR